MSPSFIVVTTPKFDRLAKRLHKQHSEFRDLLRDAVSVLKIDPANHTHRHPIKKLRNVPQGDGQYRLRLGRYRFRYDILQDTVVLAYCGLRREDTY